MISGIVVVCAAERMAEAQSVLERYPWLEIHHQEPNGRLVATLEAADANESVQRLRLIQGLPQIIMAELAEYVVED